MTNAEILKAIKAAIAIMREDCDSMIEAGSQLLTDDAGSTIAIPGTLDPEFNDDVARREAAIRALFYAHKTIKEQAPHD